MIRTIKLTPALAAIGIGIAALAGCATTSAPQTEPSETPAVRATPTPTYLTELPEWAKGTTWLIYPAGMKCSGTEGCPNDYRALIGEPGPVLPEGVEYYDPAKHDCKIVQPAGVTC
ncbi:hypothetical protein [Microbacterium sp. E-13]|uniref:hypothetical protein n=1 Tax=Microbacterium sp. E-13 TaxID=3404048 RepID=UPI003CF14126